MTAQVDDALWDEFHTLVNMTSRELQDWLATDDAKEESEPAVGPVGTPTGRAVLAVLGKRRTDLTESDVSTMRRVVDRVRAERGEDPDRRPGRPAGGAGSCASDTTRSNPWAGDRRAPPVTQRTTAGPASDDVNALTRGYDPEPALVRRPEASRTIWRDRRFGVPQRRT